MNDNQEKDDFYPTPPQAVLPLLPHLELIGNTQYDVWECACGDGAISKVLEENGLNVRSTDLIDRGYGDYGIDFLMETKACLLYTSPSPRDVEESRMPSSA